ncbi:helix-turn-helix domain-containing protein [Lysinibacillus sphaericus]|uniref:helix-turn-helix domain-containing protein n=1 Tax=Lysinibacillus sphaericus TaxID=1421 RepID=UPI0019106E10|nr:helix-turn-helix transcriptional regulator [Lysinibacillus sphaericus]QPA56272.1 helix-turn-helix transcriptional regulator [Lysinibacillus sphaericus]
MFESLEHGKMLKIFRKKAKMTQEDIADELNITQSCVSKYESGRKTLDLSAFLKWCRITNCEVEAATFLFGPELCAQAITLLQTVPMFIGGVFNWML